MKKLVNVVEVEGEGLSALLGENVALFCLGYIYSGKLVGVNDKFVQLEGAQIVYRTGALKAKTWETAEDCPSSVWYVQTACIESFGASGRK